MKRIFVDEPDSAYSSPPRRRPRKIIMADASTQTDPSVYARPKRSSRPKKAKGKRKSKSIRGQVMSVMKSMSESKFKAITLENFQLYHNAGGLSGPVVYGDLLRTDVGSTQNQRTGDSVFASYLKLRLWMSNKTDRPNVLYRVMVINAPPDQANVASPTPSIWKGINGNHIIDFINSDIYSTVYDKTLENHVGDMSLETASNQKECSITHEFTVSLNRKVSYQTDVSGTPIPKFQQDCLCLVVIPYDAYGTLITDNIASLAVSGIFVYKDF